MPAVDFCRLIANRVTYESASAHIDGDVEVASAVFAAAASLALD
jgi:hypothetical protein